MEIKIVKVWLGLMVGFIFIGASTSPVAAASLESRVNEAFRAVYGRNPTAAENGYWLGRVVRKEKKTFNALVGAMHYQKSKSATVGSATGSSPTGSSSESSKQQLIIDVLPLFVQIYGNDPTNTEKAWWRKRISCGEITTREKLVGSMRYHLSKNARKGSDAICGQKVSSGGTSAGVTRRQVAGISTHPMGDQVRIGIYKTGGAVEVTCDGSYQIREGASKILATLGKDDVVKVSWSGGKYHIRGSGISLDTVNKIRLVPLNQAIMQIKSYNDLSTTIPGKNYNRFRGIVEIRKDDASNELWAINELRAEYYLRGLAETW
jgi:hypothetical protein